MKRSATFVLLTALSLVGCGILGGGPSPDAGLAFDIPSPSSLTYTVGDTADVEIDTGMMGVIEITTSSSATLGVDFAPSAEGVQVTATFQEYSARQTNPMSGATTADLDDVSGALVFTMDRTGEVVNVEPPETEGAASQFFPAEYAYRLFPRLPGRAMGSGASWVDTVAYELEMPNGSIAPTFVFTYTLQGDTTVAGRRLLKIDADGEMTVEMLMSMEGMEVSQGFAGTLEGTVLWDPAGGMLYSSELTRSATGTVEVPAAGMPPMPLSVSGSFKVKLQSR